MAMTAASMWARVKSNMAAITPVQGNSAAANAYRDQCGIATMQGIIDEIHADAVVTVTVTTTGGPTAQAGGGTGTIA